MPGSVAENGTCHLRDQSISGALGGMSSYNAIRVEPVVHCNATHYKNIYGKNLLKTNNIKS